MSGPDMIGDVSTFMKVCGQEYPDTPTVPKPDVIALRNKLNAEEWAELQEAVINQDLAGIADGIADLIYVLIGMANSYGIPLAKVWEAVQRANMAKLWAAEQVGDAISENKKYNEKHPSPEFDGVRYPYVGTNNGPYAGWTATLVELPGMPIMYCVKDADGKVKKPPTWMPPEIERIVSSVVSPNS